MRRRKRNPRNSLLNRETYVTSGGGWDRQSVLIVPHHVMWEADEIPQEVLDAINHETTMWLRAHGYMDKDDHAQVSLDHFEFKGDVEVEFRG